MAPSHCHKCKELNCLVYPTRAPACGPCLLRKVEAAFHGPLRRAIRNMSDDARVIVVDYSVYPRLLEAFMLRCQDTINSVSTIKRAPSTSSIEAKVAQAGTVEQRRRLATQLKLATYKHMAHGGIVLRCQPASARARDSFSRLLAGEFVISDSYTGFKLIPLLGDLEPMEIAALEHHLFQGAEHFEYIAPRMDDGWLQNVERSSERIIDAFMKCISPEMPSAISNVNATAKKMQLTSATDSSSESDCSFCTIKFTNFEADWLPTGLTKIEGLCQMCCIALQNLDLSTMKEIVWDLCS